MRFNHLPRQALTFGLIGIESTLLNYGVFLALYSFFGVHYLFSATIGFLSGVSLGYFFNRSLTFLPHHTLLRESSGYLLVYVFSLFLNVGLLWGLVAYFHLNPVISNIILIPFIVLINFLGTKLLAFGDKRW